MTSICATIQLFIVGYILKMVFGLDNRVIVMLMLMIMVIVEAKSASKQGKGLPTCFLENFLNHYV
ncbi:hypothetical protein B1NLA3E_10060 [Bacillus sp. 1NLA3E]|nr:hypothetical protein B1NLA3E_10060 [Bacillus sp. 1NLA3E]